jgi:hypothetical protein
VGLHRTIAGKPVSLTLFRRGYWFLGWSEAEQPAQAQRRDQIQWNDRIAIKKMLGQGASDIEIRVLGVVRELDAEDRRVYVHWAISNLHESFPPKDVLARFMGPSRRKTSGRDWFSNFDECDHPA